jgi:hypothetical protein
MRGPAGQGGEPDERRHRSGHGRAGPHRQDLRDGGHRQSESLGIAFADEVVDAGIEARRPAAAPGEGCSARSPQVARRRRLGGQAGLPRV